MVYIRHSPQNTPQLYTTSAQRTENFQVEGSNLWAYSVPHRTTFLPHIPSVFATPPSFRLHEVLKESRTLLLQLFLPSAAFFGDKPVEML